MRHLNSGRRLGRKTGHWKADFRNLATALLLHGRIRTTEARAKELRKVVERLITLSKRVPPSSLEGREGDDLRQLQARRVHAIRLARRWVTDREVLQRLFTDYSERYKERPGGYTRIMKVGKRPGDNASLNIIELVNDQAAVAVESPSEEVGEKA
ncbi:50S ribosomal protein L17 [Myxococcota bacterium]|nr:50S ribosomal protein L17 [Myxococcota bacterium]